MYFYKSKCKRSQVQRSPFRPARHREPVLTQARRAGLVFCLDLSPMPENKGYRSEIRGFSSDFMDVRNKKSRALKFKHKILIYAL